jgi:serine protease Do
MKKVLLIAAVLCFTTWSYNASAQDDKGEKGLKGDKDKKESQEIIIRKKGDKDTKITVEISGDKVTINGKPLSEFKDDEITINRRNIIVRDGKGNNRYSITTPDMFDGFSGFWSDDHAMSRAFLGVTTETVDDGAKITDVSKESAAEKSGLKEGDIITKVGDKKVEGPESLYDIISGKKPKDEVTVYYKRGGKESSTKAVLGEHKMSPAMAYSFSGPDGIAKTYTLPRKISPSIKVAPRVETWNTDPFAGGSFPKIYGEGLGDNYNYSFGDGVFARRARLGVKIQDTDDGNGVKILDVEKDSPADKAGLKKDDVLTEIGGEKVTNTDQAREQLSENAEKASYNVKATRNGSSMTFDIKIPKKLKTANL